MLAEICPDILVLFGLALPHIYGLSVQAAILVEFNHSVTYNIYIAKFAISIWICHESHYDLLSVVEHQLDWLVAIHWLIKAKECLV